MEEEEEACGSSWERRERKQSEFGAESDRKYWKTSLITVNGKESERLIVMEHLVLLS